MSKINQTSQADGSNSKTLSNTPKPPIKDLPKLEVVKVIAPKSLESIQAEEQLLIKQSSDESFKAALPVPKVVPAVRIKSVNISRSVESQPSPFDPTTNLQANKIQEDKFCLQPIPDATEPFQYRAIGVISGRYIASEDNFAKGHILTTDGSEVDAVLLGKIISIVKKRLEGDREYLWVVYPRTNDKAGRLHVQIAGVWAPVELGKSDVPIDPNIQDGYFSVRGEISTQSTAENSVIVKVRRTEQKFDKEKDKVSKEYSKFKVRLTGLLPTDAVGQFWSVNVQRQGDVLTIIDGEFIGHVPYKGKRGSQTRGRTSGSGQFAPRRYGSNDRTFSDRPFKPSTMANNSDGLGSIPRPRSSEDRPPVPRPLIKRKDSTDT